LEDFLRLFRGYVEGGEISLLQVQQVESQLLQSRTFAFTRNQRCAIASTGSSFNSVSRSTCPCS